MTEAVKQSGVLALLSPKASAKGPNHAEVSAFGDMLRGAGHAKGKKDDGLDMPNGAKVRWEMPQPVDGETTPPVDTTEMTLETRKPAPTRKTGETHVTSEAIARLVMRRDDRATDQGKAADVDDADDAQVDAPDPEDEESAGQIGASETIIQFSVALELLRRGDRSEETPPVQRKAAGPAVAETSEAAPGSTTKHADQVEPKQAAGEADAPAKRAAGATPVADMPIEGLISAEVETQSPVPASQQKAVQAVVAAQVLSTAETPPSGEPQASAPATSQPAIVARMEPVAAVQAVAPVPQVATLVQVAPVAEIASAVQLATVRVANADSRNAEPVDPKVAATPSADSPAPKSAATAAAIAPQPATRQAPGQNASDPRQPGPSADGTRGAATVGDGARVAADGATKASPAAAPEARRIESAQVKSAGPAADIQASSTQPPPPSQNATAIVAAISTDPTLRPGVETLAQTLMRMTSANGGPVQTLKVQLNPVELGVVTAEMRFAGEQLSVELQVDNPDAYQRLMLDKDTIAKSLRALGFDVDTVSVQQPQITTNASVRADIGNGSPGGFTREDSNFQSWSSSGGNDRAGSQASGRERDNGGNRHETSGSAGQNSSGSGLYI